MGRGPAYPYINLGDAVGLTKKLYEFTKRAPANLNSVLKDKWGYSPTSSSAVKIVAALKYYGLADTSPGTTKDAPESIRITDRAYRILVDSDASPERSKALKEACLSPKAYKLCWDTWGEDLPESMRSTLIFTHQFNDSTVDGFLSNYRKSIEYAGLLDAVSSLEPADQRQSAEKSLLKVGDWVQWEHDGVLGLPRSLRITKLSADESHAWVEGSSTGLPVAELIQAEPSLPPTESKDTGSRVINIPVGQVRAIGGQTPRFTQKGSVMRQESIALPEGDAVLQWPESIGSESIGDVEQWVSFLLKRLRRSLGDAASNTPAPKPRRNGDDDEPASE